MRQSCLILALSALLLVCLAHAASRTIMEPSILRAEEELMARPAYADWKVDQKLNAEETVTLIFALKQRNIDQLEQLWYRVGTPGDSLYGQFLTQQKLADLIAPAPEAKQAVLSYLSAEGVTEIDDENDFVVIRVPASKAESLVEAPFYWFTNSKLPKTKLIRAIGAYSLPSEIAKHVDFVGGVKRLPRVQKVKKEAPSVMFNKNANAPSQWGAVVDPVFLRNLYQVNASGGNPKNSQSVVQFLQEYYSSYDLNEFFTMFWPRAYGRQPSVIGPNDFGAGAEASLDIQYIMSVGDAVPTTFWSVPYNASSSDQFLQWILDVNKNPSPPLVFSVSYGDDEDQVTREYAQRVNIELMKQGVRGISILFASGDSGVGGNDSPKCKRFVPDFPATSPYSTAVGGTYSTGLLMDGPEAAIYLSGGGFSNYWPRPPFQTKAVETYLATAPNLPAPAYYNRTGRAYPDVSAQAWNFIIVVDLAVVPGVAGTSCAAPTFSGIVALLNEVRLNAGKSPLGPLNPMLYKLAVDHPEAFTDITSGNNPGCYTNGFFATKGWDPASGLGSPRYAEMAKWILQY